MNWKFLKESYLSNKYIFIAVVLGLAVGSGLFWYENQGQDLEN